MWLFLPQMMDIQTISLLGRLQEKAYFSPSQFHRPYPTKNDLLIVSVVSEIQQHYFLSYSQSEVTRDLTKEDLPTQTKIQGE
ncbi:unnamed protein product [Paramecium sonneborni]|uniref:Uncharacterized protein n=1 Tax=Paramecium sonneborni TaxID=65129 RepID=A0A8S1R9X9_9CILI|nr:unnamed protein product [Paramecium sonneborni]